MTQITKTLTVDGAEVQFVLRKPTFEDTVYATDKAQIPAFDARGIQRTTAAQQMRMMLHLLSRCVISPEAYRDASKLGQLLNEDVNALQEALSPSATITPKPETPSDSASSPAA